MSFIINTLFQLTLISSALIIGTLLLEKAVGKHLNSVYLDVLWLIVLVRLCVPVTINSSMSVLNLFSTWQTAQANNQHATLTFGEKLPFDIASYASHISENVALISYSNYVKSALVIIWAIGAISILYLQLKRIYRLNEKLKFCKELNSREMLDILEANKRKLNIKTQVKILLCDTVKSPATHGFSKPCILMPTAFAISKDYSQQNMILLHELCHIKRADIFVKYIWMLAKALYWFNPLVWIACKRAGDSIELCCDQKVIMILGCNKRFDYGQALIDIAKKSNTDNWTAVTSSICEGKSVLKRRILRIVDHTNSSIRATIVFSFTTLILLISSFTSIWLPTPAEKIIFGGENPLSVVQEQRAEVTQSSDDAELLPKAESNEKTQITAATLRPTAQTTSITYPSASAKPQVTAESTKIANSGALNAKPDTKIQNTTAATTKRVGP